MEMLTKCNENKIDDKYSFLLDDLKDNNHSNDVPYSMSKISVISSGHSDIDFI